MKAVIPPDNSIRYMRQYQKVIPKVFLGGSIEMGKADNWQQQAIESLDECIIFNPRRDDWDSSWKQIPEPDTEFSKQVEWEIRAQQNSDIIIYNFLPDTQSPITLLELGFSFALPAFKFVCCPKEYFRHGNVAITTRLLGYPKSSLYTDFEDMLQAVKWKLNDICYNDDALLSEWIKEQQIAENGGVVPIDDNTETSKI